VAETVEIICGDALTWLRELPAESVHMCVTSPPYWGLRAYLPTEHPDKTRELGTEKTLEEYVARLNKNVPLLVEAGNA